MIKEEILGNSFHMFVIVSVGITQL